MMNTEWCAYCLEKIAENAAIACRLLECDSFFCSIACRLRHYFYEH